MCFAALLRDCAACSMATVVLFLCLWSIAVAAGQAYPDVFGPPVVSMDVPFSAASLGHYYFPSPPPPAASAS